MIIVLSKHNFFVSLFSTPCQIQNSCLVEFLKKRRVLSSVYLFTKREESTDTYFPKCIRVLCNDLKGKVLMEFWRRHLCGQTPAGSYVLVLEAMIEAEENSLTIKKGYEKNACLCIELFNSFASWLHSLLFWYSSGAHYDF